MPGSAPDLGEAKAQFQGFADAALQSGTGDNQADRVFADSRTLAASANEDLDLAGGSLVDPLGAPGGVFMVAAPRAGWAVTPGIGDLLRIANSAGGSGIQYDIEIIGTSA